MPQRAARRRSIPRADHETLADLRYHIRRLVRIREEVARAAGIEPQQYVERLQIRHHATRGGRRIDIAWRGCPRKLALYSLAELRTGGPELASRLTRVIALNGGQRRGR